MEIIKYIYVFALSLSLIINYFVVRGLMRLQKVQSAHIRQLEEYNRTLKKQNGVDMGKITKPFIEYIEDITLLLDKTKVQKYELSRQYDQSLTMIDKLLVQINEKLSDQNSLIAQGYTNIIIETN